MQLVQDHGGRSIETLQMDRPGHARPDIRPGREESADGDLQFVQLMSILRRRRKLIIWTTVIGTLLATGIALLIAPKYTATAQIMVDPQQADAVGAVGAGIRSPEESAIDTQVTMLSSRDHLERVLDSFSASSTAGAPATDAKPADNLPAGIERDVEELDRHLKVMQVRRSRVISINFTAKSSQSAAIMANRIADLHIADTVAAKRAEIRHELKRLETRADKLKADMAQGAEALRKALGQPTAGADETRLAELKRESISAGQGLAGVLRRQKELREQEESVTPEAHILSRAAPPDRPSSPSRILFIFPALIISLICGCLLAVLRERLDRGLRSERDVTEALGIPCIGLIPQLPGFSSTSPYRCVVKEPFAPYTEAIRSSVAALQLSSSENAPSTVLISSSVPGEGKTTLAVSLAVYAAHLGRRTLLIDFDFRHPSMLRGRHSKKQAAVPDLQHCPAATLVDHVPDLNIDYLPIPSSSIDPLTLFTAEHLQNFLQQVRHNYDCVFIDSPPLLGVTEARLLSAIADKILFIIKWGSTRREVARNALNTLHNQFASGQDDSGKTSAVITQVDLTRHANYRYGDSVETFVKYKKYYFRPIGNP